RGIGADGLELLPERLHLRILRDGLYPEVDRTRLTKALFRLPELLVPLFSPLLFQIFLVALLERDLGFLLGVHAALRALVDAYVALASQLLDVPLHVRADHPPLKRNPFVRCFHRSVWLGYGVSV